MEDLLAFLDELEQDEDLNKAFLEVKDFDDVCRLAKHYGYYFTVDELKEYYMQQVAGGEVALVHSDSFSGAISQNVNGDGNRVLNFGGVTVAGGCIDGTQKVSVDPMAVLGELEKLGVLGKKY